jgi:NIPSNAP
MPHEGTDHIAYGLISFESLAACEAYRARLKTDRDGVENFGLARRERFILSEERSFLRQVE